MPKFAQRHQAGPLPPEERSGRSVTFLLERSGRTYDEIEKLFDGLQRIYQSKSLTLVRSPLGQLFAERLPLWRARYGRVVANDSH